MDNESKESAKQPNPPPTGFVFHPENGSKPAKSTANHPHASNKQVITWTASEAVSQDKTAGWFLLLGVATLVIAAVVYLLTHDKLTAVVVVVVAIVFGFFAARRPRTLTYALGKQGIQIDAKLYPYESFKSFSLLEEGALVCILLMPMRRFMPPLTVYYLPQDEEKVLGMLSDYLPFEDRKRDLIDQAMRKIRF